MVFKKAKSFIVIKQTRAGQYLTEVNAKHNNNGFTFVEVLVSLGLFAILVSGVLGAFATLSQATKASREKVAVSSLASNYLEIVKNMPYSQVGTLYGNPTGTLADASNPISVTINGGKYQIFYEVTHIDDPADGTVALNTDSAPNDYKQVKMKIKSLATNQITNFLTNVAPKGIAPSTGGTLKIKVINAVGQPVVGADVHIENLARTPDIVLDRVTDSNGEVLEIDLPAWVNGYHLVATKAGYSQDQTYPLTTANPNPIKPDATVSVGTVTQVTLAIDLLANLTIKTLDEFCANISGVNLNVSGAKLVGTIPNVLKFSNNYTSSAGVINLNNIEWDTYTPVLLTGQPYVVLGTSPIQKIDVLPGSSQVFTMILSTNSTANSLLVIVKDSATGVPLEGASVHLRKGGSVPQDYYAYTGGSVWVQSDWTGGSGESNWDASSKDKYWADDGNVDINSAPTGIRLKKTSGNYEFSGWVESSTFDTGTAASNYTTLVWQPQSQNPSTTLRIQLAANNDNTTWNYVGPDGTSATYYTVPGSGISSALDNKRYVRYKVFLSTTNDKKTPVLTSLNINYVSGCYTPGQVFFKDLTSGNNYDIEVTLAGYEDFSINSTTVSGEQILEVLMSP